MPFTDGKTYVTLNTDAGFKEGIVTYGIWISSEQGRFKHSGKSKNLYEDSTQAEMIALVEGIRIIVKNNHILNQCNVLVFNTDSLNSIKFLQKRRDKLRTKYLLMYDSFHLNLNIIKKNCPNLSYKFKHVKGHSSNDKGARYFVNNWCDGIARQLREPEHLNSFKK